MDPFIQNLLDQGASPDALLVAAAEYGDGSLVGRFLDEGASPNGAPDRPGSSSPLHHAVRRGETDMVERLLAAGASVPMAEADNNSLLATATHLWSPFPNERDMERMGLVPLLLQHGADVMGTDEDGHTALHRLTQNPTEEAFAASALLIKHSANVNAIDGQGGTPLQYAVAKNDLDRVDLLLDAGADLMIKTKHGHTLAAEVRDFLPYWTAEYMTEDHTRAQEEAKQRILGHVERAELHASLEAILPPAPRTLRSVDLPQVNRRPDGTERTTSTLDAAHPPESVHGPSAHVRLSNDPMNRAPREDLGAPDPKPDKPRRVRL